MAGGMFAGHDQSGGELIERDGKKYKLFYGMSSSTAMQVFIPYKTIAYNNIEVLRIAHAFSI